MSTIENKEWKPIVRKYGIIILIWLGTVAIIISIIAIMGQIEHIRWHYYWDMKYIGYTIGIPLLAFYLIYYPIIAFQNSKKHQGEKTKPTPLLKFLFPFFLMYLTMPIIAGFIPL
jgi:hypothetical protein